MLRTLRHALALLLLPSCLLAAPALADTYPSKTIRIVVPFPPGGPTDLTARTIASHMSTMLNTPVIVDNRPGAAGVIALDNVARSPADGYSIVFGTVTTLIIGPAVAALEGRTLPFDPIKSFSPITLVTDAPIVLVSHPSLPVNTVKELITYAKAHPELNAGSDGPGSITHLALELMNKMAGTSIVHLNYKGSAPYMNDMLGNQVQVGFEGTVLPIQYAKQGRMKIIAAAGKTRIASLPDVPTVAESGLPGFEISSWYGLLAPAGTDPAIIKKLNETIRTIMARPDVVEVNERMGQIAISSTPQEMATLLDDDSKRWLKFMRDNNIKLGN